jgi:hypothetical protein
VTIYLNKGDYTFCGEDTRPHEWGVMEWVDPDAESKDSKKEKIGWPYMKLPDLLKPKPSLHKLTRMTYEDFMVHTKDLDTHALGVPSLYYVTYDGVCASVYPRADKDYVVVQLEEQTNG